MTLVDIQKKLARKLDELEFAAPVALVYNPLVYAWEPHEAYLRRFGSGRGRVLLLGMNPGPFGMVQTGVPFGEVGLVREWMGIEGRVKKPAREHPKRPIEGFACKRSEVSGARLWGWAKERFEHADAFFEQFFVANYCPLAFLEDTGRNRTPDKLPARERAPLFELCDEALRQTVAELQPSLIVGIGAFAEQRARQVLPEAFEVGCVLHPSPANPRANRGWAREAEGQLRALGLSL